MVKFFNSFIQYFSLLLTNKVVVFLFIIITFLSILSDYIVGEHFQEYRLQILHINNLLNNLLVCIVGVFLVSILLTGSIKSILLVEKQNYKKVYAGIIITVLILESIAYLSYFDSVNWIMREILTVIVSYGFLFFIILVLDKKKVNYFTYKTLLLLFIGALIHYFIISYFLTSFFFSLEDYIQSLLTDEVYAYVSWILWYFINLIFYVINTIWIAVFCFLVYKEGYKQDTLKVESDF